MFGFFRTLLVDPADLDPAVDLVRKEKYPGNDFLPGLPMVRSVFTGEVPWSPRFAVRSEDDDGSRRALRRAWDDDGIGLTQVAVELSTGEGDSPTTLERSYDVPSFEFAARFELRQLPGALDLVSLDGIRASATFRAQDPWEGHLPFLRRDLVTDFAGDRRIVQVAWGERTLTADWNAEPPWARAVYQAYQHIWRDARVLDKP